jgi:predicted ribosome quality control (RQC) complex YloA/Tae2 family protein
VDPWSLDTASLEKVLGPEPSEDVLVDRLLGVGKVLAREILARCRSAPESPAATLKDLLSEIVHAQTGGHVLACGGQQATGVVPLEGGSHPPREERTSQGLAPSEGDRMSVGGMEHPDGVTTPEEDNSPSPPGKRAPRLITPKDGLSTMGTLHAPLALGFKPSFVTPAEVMSTPTVNDALRKAFILCRNMKLEQGQRRTVAKGVRAELKRVARTRHTLENELDQAQGAAGFRRKGDLILAHIARISKGQKILKVPFSETGTRHDMHIVLKAHLTPAENAATYFKRAKKLEKKLSFLPGRIEQLSKRESRLRERLDGALSGPLPPTTIKKPGPVHRSGKKQDGWPTGVSPRRFMSSDGWTMYVGRNNRENDYITFAFARPEDFWFHAQGVAGSHVILRREGRRSRPSKRCLEEAGSVAAYFSKGRTSQTVSVIYTEKKYVRKPRKAKAGAALYSHEKTLMVSPVLPPTTVEQP